MGIITVILRKVELKKLLTGLRMQIILLTFLIIIHLFSILGIIPTVDEMIGHLKTFFDKHGIWSIAIISFLENIIIINISFPGSIVIITAMALTQGNLEMAFAMYWAIVIPAILGQHMNFLISKYFKLNIEKLLRTNKDNMDNLNFYKFWLSFIHPQTASLSSYIAASKGFSYKKYLSYFIPSSLFWSLFWGTIVYNFGARIKPGRDFVIIFYAYFLWWVLSDSYSLLNDSKS